MVVLIALPPRLISQDPCKHQDFSSFCLQYETLVVFNTSRNKTTIIDKNPALFWKGGVLPNDVPENTGGLLN